MSRISIRRTEENDTAWVFAVEVAEPKGLSHHRVTVDKHYFEKLVEGDITPERLVELSFEFLLEREPKESILSEFNIAKIESYFPEYKNWMGEYLDL